MTRNCPRGPCENQRRSRVYGPPKGPEPTDTTSYLRRNAVFRWDKACIVKEWRGDCRSCAFCKDEQCILAQLGLFDLSNVEHWAVVGLLIVGVSEGALVDTDQLHLCWVTPRKLKTWEGARVWATARCSKPTRFRISFRLFILSLDSYTCTYKHLPN